MINGIMNTLTNLLGPSGPVIALGVFGIFLVTLTLPFILVKPKDPFDRIKNTPNNFEKRPAKASTSLNLRQNKNGPNLDKFASFLEPQDQEALSKSRLNLMRAGYRSRDAVRTFHFAQFALLSIGLVLGLIYAFIISGNTELIPIIQAVAVPVIAGYFAPIMWIKRRASQRLSELERGFPDSLDLMLVCIEAGQSLDQSINRVGMELNHSYPSLSEEYIIVSNEMRAGKDKPSVLKDFAERSGVDDIKSFVTVLVQSATFGTSIGDSLRVYAAEMRDKRIMSAEEKANKLPTKMTLSTMMFTIPPLLIMLVGPSVYQIMQNFG
ncbi:type II secretion system F family protein [Amylibacter sp. SFDW26]|uniref:type II secretion system F family protein n=1 Tax=Amylibacter sp. SFDW26 TaxID=2652722 RepID=UPI0012628EA8|nr:type II secretion system F family protein [Amylibacter sp. SFDW26]KAB7613469.1 type II secretion system F family protein [Amylibacter sp. SFDW26]